MKINPFGFLKDSSVDSVFKEKIDMFPNQRWELKTLQMRWGQGATNTYSLLSFILGGKKSVEYEEKFIKGQH